MNRPPARRDDVLRIVKEAPEPTTIADVARRLGVHPNTARFHLEALVRDGSLDRASAGPSGRGRPPLAYVARPGMDRHAPRHYEVLAGALVRHVGRGAEPRRAAVAAGEAWGRAHADASRAHAKDPVRSLVALLDDLGFAPETLAPADDGATGGDVRLGLRSCPFLELADDRTVVCGVHLGLMRGALDAWEAPVHAGTLEPFVRPDLCVAHLTRDTDPVTVGEPS